MPGSWTKRGNDSYKLQVYCGADYNGKPKRYTKTVHCKSDAAANKELAKFYTACEAGDVTKPNTITLSALCTKVMDECLQMNLKKTTITGYKAAIKNHIDPDIGNLQVAKIKTVNIQSWISLLLKKDLSPKSVKNYFSVLDVVLGYALRWEMIKSNPCANVTLPRLEKKEADYYDKNEFIKLVELLSLVKDDELKFSTAVMLLVFSGIRRGELHGLDWNEVYFEKSGIRIVKTRMYSAGFGAYEDTPKTNKSKRWVSLPDSCMRMLKRLKALQAWQKNLIGSKWIDSGAVFTNSFGEPLWHQQVLNWFTKFQQQNGLRHITLHQLRHTHASMLVNMTDDIAQISRRIGHSQISTTTNIYTHLFENTDTSLAVQMEGTYLKNVNIK